MSKKRIFDLVIASILLVVCMPLLLCIACIVWLDSPGPVLFKQNRLGRNRNLFLIFKFKTMYEGAEKLGCPTVPGDRRITRTGKLLRSSHLDELPQLWNVVKGEMSLVGPRALSVARVAQIESEVPEFGERFAVTPGMTGPVQVLGRTRAFAGGVRQAVLLDLAYIKDQTLFMDLKILLQTAVAVTKLQGI